MKRLILGPVVFMIMAGLFAACTEMKGGQMGGGMKQDMPKMGMGSPYIPEEKVMMMKKMMMSMEPQTLEDSMARGKKLFNDTTLGMNNMCIMTFLKGMPLDLNSQEAIDLTAHVTSFSKRHRIDPGGMKIVPTPVPGAM